MASGIDVEAKLAAAAGAVNAAEAQLTRLLQAELAGDEWKRHGLRSIAHWVAWRTGSSISRAHLLVRVAGRAGEFPTIMAAFDRGQLTLEQTEAVLSGAPAWADDQLLYVATQCTVAQLKRIMRERFFDDGTTPQPDEQPVPRDRLSTSHTDEGRWRISGEADPEAGAIIDAALDEARDALFRAGNERVTNVDALVEMAKRSLASIPSTSRRERHRLNLYLDVNGSIATRDGWKLPATVAEQLLCDAEITPIWTRNGIAFNQGRTTRTIPTHLRNHILRRDRGSRAPGDTDTKHLEIHHIEHWEHGGRTDTDNLIAISQRVHRLIHQGTLSVEGNADDPNGLIWRDEHGRILDNSGRPIPPPEILRPSGEYRPPCGERLDMDFIGWEHPAVTARRHLSAQQFHHRRN